LVYQAIKCCEQQLKLSDLLLVTKESRELVAGQVELA
jgi:hypothetical protein